LLDGQRVWHQKERRACITRKEEHQREGRGGVEDGGGDVMQRLV
jgi:hypothetical protein